MLEPDMHVKVHDPVTIHTEKCKKLAKCIITDVAHPLNKCFELLPHNIRYRSLMCRTTRFSNTFVPTAVRLLNS